MSLISSCSVQSYEQEPLLVNVEYDSHTATARMILFGEVDGANAEQLQKAVIDTVRQHRPTRIELDFHGVTFLDSTGVRTLILCQADAQQIDCRLTLVDTPPIVYRVLEITALLDHFGVPRLVVPQPAPRTGPHPLG